MDVFMEYTRTPIVVYYDDKLPEAGLYGNTHFPMPDLNNAEVAQLMYGWLRGKKAGLRTPKAETRKSTQAKKRTARAVPADAAGTRPDGYAWKERERYFRAGVFAKVATKKS